MTYEMTSLMTLIDVLIIGLVSYAFWVFQKRKKSVLVKKLRTDFSLIALGLGLFGFHFLCNLFCLHIFQMTNRRSLS